MRFLTLSLVAFTSVFAVFEFYITWYVKNYRGAGKGFELLLTYVAFAAMCFHYGFLVLFAWKVSISGAGLLLLCGFVLFLPVMAIETALRKTLHPDVPYFLGLLALPGLPLAGWLMVRAWPVSTGA